jgi:hypothetical protein
MTAMSGRSPFARALVDRDRPEVLRRRRPDDLGGRRSADSYGRGARGSFSNPRARLARRALLLGGDLRRRQIALERVVLLLEVPQTDVAAPHPPHARDDAGHRALRLLKDPERDRFEHRHAALRVDLRGNQDDMQQHHGHEEDAGCAGEDR